GLFKQQSAKNLDIVAQQLVDDVRTLQTRILAFKVAPETLARSAARIMRLDSNLALDGSSGEYSRTGLADMQGSVQGAGIAVSLLRPLLERVDVGLAQRIDGDFQELIRTLAQYRTRAGLITDDSLQGKQREA